MTGVLIGMSGGVDSSVAAHLLKKEGYSVEGVIFKQVNVDSCDIDPNAICCSASAVEDAEAVGRQLGVRVRSVDLREKFDLQVVKPTQKAYLEGKTPSPCLDCNQKVRAPALNYYRFIMGLDYFATGHYFRNEKGRILRGVDPKKDQSYMVALVERKFFETWLTPLGNMVKETDVRNVAKELNLPTAHNPDSQDLCFKHLLPVVERKLYYEGFQVGTHTGRPTLGQKKGFNGKRVLRVLNEEVHLGDHDEVPLSSECTLRNVNLLVDELPSHFEIQSRYHAKVKSASLFGNTLYLAEADLLCPGQVVAFYNADHLLGGGIIT